MTDLKKLMAELVDNPQVGPRPCSNCNKNESGGPCYGADLSGPDGYDFDCTAEITQDCDTCFYIWCDECKKELIDELGFETEGLVKKP